MDRTVFRLGAAVCRFYMRCGNVLLVGPDGETVACGDGSGRRVTLKFHTPGAIWHLMSWPELRLGEGYVDGRWSLVDGRLDDLIDAGLRNQERLKSLWPVRFAAALRRAVFLVRQKAPVDTCRRNVAHHYDFGNDWYAAFLDRSMTYSCAFFKSPDQSLEDAQRNKIDTTLDRLGVEAGMSVLDIGCGWGETSRRAVIDRQARALGITLSQHQHDWAAREAERLGLGSRLGYRLQDYREHGRGQEASRPPRYDRIVSIGMFEHVGFRQFKVFFRHVRRLLAEDGLALVHSIVRDRPDVTNAWIDRYIFPGGYIPTTDEMVSAARKSGLVPVAAPFDQPGEHYRRTLELWEQRFDANADRLQAQGYDARAHRLYRFYFNGCQASFSNELYVTQVVFAPVDSPALAYHRDRLSRGRDQPDLIAAQ